eukprot:jgi/Psemu1/27821/gm1.27821_g
MSFSRTYRHVWTLHPKSETIVKDINKVLRSFLEAAEAEGIAIDGIGDRSGRRHLPRGQHEGRGVRKLDIHCYDKGEIELHEDSEDAGDLILAKAEAKFNLNNVLTPSGRKVVAVGRFLSPGDILLLKIDIWCTRNVVARAPLPTV